MINVEPPSNVVILSYIVGLAGIAGGIYGFFRFSNYKATVQLQNDNIKALQDKVGILEDQLKDAKEANVESNKELSKLAGKLESYKEIPLQEISSSLSKLADSNQQILNTLQNSALISADNNDSVSVKTEKTITVPSKATS